jgi:hypothetical protein
LLRTDWHDIYLFFPLVNLKNDSPGDFPRLL